MNKEERTEADKNKEKLDFEKMQFLHKKSEENINPEEFDVSSEKEKAEEKHEEIDWNYEDFEGEETKPIKKERKNESKDEYQEDLENYEEFINPIPDVEESDTQKNYFDDWDYKNPEKIALEKQKKEEKKKERQRRKKEREDVINAFLKKVSDIVHDKNFWIKVVLIIAILAMFITVFAAVFVGKSSGGEQVIEIPDNGEETANTLLRILTK